MDGQSDIILLGSNHLRKNNSHVIIYAGFTIDDRFSLEHVNNRNIVYKCIINIKKIDKFDVNFFNNTALFDMDELECYNSDEVNEFAEALVNNGFILTNN